MIYIVRGEINAGKTSWMAEDFRHQEDADGFVCRKIFSAGEHTGYDLERLTDGSRCRFIRKPGHIPPNWHEVAFLAEKFSFCAEGFEFAGKIAESALANGCRRFYLDEVGPLELMQQGFYELLGRMLQNQPPELVIAVRSYLVEPVIELFGISDYEEINIV
ncbi:MAG: hypothetical protein CVV42_16115 [Candidatus Riflebacteria bacterium HGW-Riflebacteria-2]|jgi:nucleoside-triphosphatase THEP1|nr:MAG: hypothetical protein CVV42_16115 [Candidatus Riflebacteria bacterium HGW-Riflebacteria-2]